MFGITPKIGVQLMHKAIESELKTKIAVFKMVYDAQKKDINFHIPFPSPLGGGQEEVVTRVYPYINQSVFSAIEAMSKKQLKNNTFIIDKVIIDAKDKEYTFNLYYRNESGEKLYNTIKL